MGRIVPVMLAVLGSAAPCQATDYKLLSLPELVARADAIVVGTVTGAESPCRVTVSRTLAGTAGRVVEFPRHPDAGLRAGDARVLFLNAGKSGLALVYPLATRPTDQADAVARLVAMRADPAKYLADPGAAAAQDFLETLGWAFADREAVGSLDRKAAAMHLQRALGGREPGALVTAIAALRRMGAKDATAVVPLVRHPDDGVRVAAMRFLAWAPDKAAVTPLCEVLDGIKGHSPLEEPVGRALMAIGDPAAVPALERAARRGVYGATSWALGRLGGKASCEALMAGVDRDAMDALEGMMAMVRRSNKRFEPWMGVNSWSPGTGLEHKGDWRRWWDANKDSFELVRTAEEAFRGGR
jgi:hypothetical protein